MTVYEQLRDFCDCLPEMEEKTFKRNVDELIHLISALTCWQQNPCETFLNSERVEFVDIGQIDPCVCDGGIVKFKPFYRPFQPETIWVDMMEVRGLDECITPMSDYMYSEAFDELRIDVSPYMTSDRCGCPAERRLRIQYDAGYPKLPECLLQIFCDILHVIADKNNCDCEACQTCKPGEDDVTIEYLDGDEVSPKLEKYLNRLVENGYKSQLGLISLCDSQPEIWGVVV